MYRCSKLVYNRHSKQWDSSIRWTKAVFTRHVSLQDIFVVIKSSTRQNVQQIKSCAGQNEILPFSARQLSDVWPGLTLVQCRCTVLTIGSPGTRCLFVFVIIFYYENVTTAKKTNTTFLGCLFSDHFIEKVFYWFGNLY